MPGDTPVNAQITDSVTQANVSILGDAPAIAMANAYQVFAQVVGASMQNAVSNQQGANSDRFQSDIRNSRREPGRGIPHLPAGRRESVLDNFY